VIPCKPHKIAEITAFFLIDNLLGISMINAHKTVQMYM
jgi:hypothetical protein